MYIDRQIDMRGYSAVCLKGSMMFFGFEGIMGLLGFTFTELQLVGAKRVMGLWFWFRV